MILQTDAVQKKGAPRRAADLCPDLPFASAFYHIEEKTAHLCHNSRKKRHNSKSRAFPLLLFPLPFPLLYSRSTGMRMSRLNLPFSAVTVMTPP